MCTAITILLIGWAFSAALAACCAHGATLSAAAKQLLPALATVAGVKTAMLLAAGFMG